MSSATLTPGADEAHRFPWRATLVIIFLLGLAGYSIFALYPATRDFQAEQRLDDLPLAGPLAEEVEMNLAGGETDNAVLAQAASDFFTIDNSLAYVRLWDPELKLRCEVLRTEPNTPHLGGHGTLPELGLRTATTPLQGRLRDVHWIAPIVRMQELLISQTDLTDLLQQAAGEGKGNAKVQSNFYVLQSDLLDPVQELAYDYPLLRDASGAMEHVLDALTAEGDGHLREATDASIDAETSLTLALETYRARISLVHHLPETLATAAPLPKGQLEKLLPMVYGRRILIPLFQRAVSAEMATPAGYAEVVFYDRPAHAITTLRWHLRAVGGMVLGLLVVICWPRRRKRRLKEPAVYQEHEDHEDTKALKE